MRAGDILSPTGRTVVVDAVRDGLYERGANGQWLMPKRAWPKGKCEVVLDDGQGCRYWGRSTIIHVITEGAIQS